MLIWHQVTSITADNGSEFAKLEEVQAELKTRCFLCHPYCSREKWSNEKNNREVRYYIPKKSNIHSYTQQQLQDIQDKINRKPRKILGYLSAHESYYWVRLTYLN
jgi:IS30 family transposase